MQRELEKNFEKHLLPMAGSGRILALDLGLANPDAAAWMLRNLVNTATDHLFAIDDFSEAAGSALKALGTDLNFNNATVYGGPSLTRLLHPPPKLGMELQAGPKLIYLDGVRQPRTVLTVSAIAWHYLRLGGVMIWNAYRTSRQREVEVLKTVDAFLASVGPTQHKVLWTNQQLAVEKLGDQ